MVKRDAKQWWWRNIHGVNIALQVDTWLGSLALILKVFTMLSPTIVLPCRNFESKQSCRVQRYMLRIQKPHHHFCRVDEFVLMNYLWNNVGLEWKNVVTQVALWRWAGYREAPTLLYLHFNLPRMNFHQIDAHWSAIIIWLMNQKNIVLSPFCFPLSFQRQKKSVKFKLFQFQIAYFAPEKLTLKECYVNACH